MSRKANASPAGGGGGAWADPTVYQRKAAVEAKLGRTLTLAEFRQSEHWVPPPADNFSQAGRNASKPYGSADYNKGFDEKTRKALGVYMAVGGAAIGRQGDAQDRTSMPAGLTMIENYDGATRSITGTSIFDPVLSELVYRWFCPPGGLVLDPFAGGSVRGIVASWLGRRYLGVDLSGRQIAANRAQGESICAGKVVPEWREGDARDLATVCAGVEADFVFSCPPYWNLERYSDDERDLSTLDDFDAFYAAYAAIIAAAAALLKPDRFACFVVGDVRGSRGFYCGLPGKTVAAFQAAGLELCNDAVLVTAVGSLPVRVRGQFEASRKLGKTHQNVLIFCKGDPRKATEAIGSVEFGDVVGESEAGEPVPDSVEEVAAPPAAARGDIGGAV